MKRLVNIIVAELLILTQLPVSGYQIRPDDRILRRIRSTITALDITFGEERGYEEPQIVSFDSSELTAQVEKTLRENIDELEEPVGISFINNVVTISQVYGLSPQEASSLLDDALKYKEDIEEAITELIGLDDISGRYEYILPWIGILLETKVREEISFEEAVKNLKLRINLLANLDGISEIVKQGLNLTDIEKIDFTDPKNVSYLATAADNLWIAARAFDLIGSKFGEEKEDAFADFVTAVVGLRSRYRIPEEKLFSGIQNILNKAGELSGLVASLMGKEIIDLNNLEDLSALSVWLFSALEDMVKNNNSIDVSLQRIKAILEYSQNPSIKARVLNTLGKEELDYTNFDQMYYLSMPARLEILKLRVKNVVRQKISPLQNVQDAWAIIAGNLGEIMLNYGVSENEVIKRLVSIVENIEPLLTSLPGFKGEIPSLTNPEDIKYILPWVTLGIEMGVKYRLGIEESINRVKDVMARAKDEKIMDYRYIADLASDDAVSRWQNFLTEFSSVLKNPLVKGIVYTGLGVGLASAFNWLIGGGKAYENFFTNLPAFFGYGYVFGKLAESLGRAVIDKVKGNTERMSYNIYNVVSRGLLSAITALYGFVLSGNWSDLGLLAGSALLPYVYINSYVARNVARTLFAPRHGSRRTFEQDITELDPNIDPEKPLPLAYHGAVVLTAKNYSVNEAIESFYTIRKSFEENYRGKDDNFKMIILSATTNPQVRIKEIELILELQDKYGKDKIYYIPVNPKIARRKHESYQALIKYLQEGYTHPTSYTNADYRLGKVQDDNFLIQFGGDRVRGGDYYLDERYTVFFSTTQGEVVDIKDAKIQTKIVFVNMDNPSERFEMYKGDLYRLNNDGTRGELVLRKEQYLIDNGVIKDRQTGENLSVQGLPQRVYKVIEQRLMGRNNNGEEVEVEYVIGKDGSLYDRNGNLVVKFGEYQTSKVYDLYDKNGTLKEKGLALTPTFAVERKRDLQSIRENFGTYLRFVRYDEYGAEKEIYSEGDLVDRYFRPVVIDGRPVKRGEYKIVKTKEGYRLYLNRFTSAEFVLDNEFNLIDPRTGKVIAQKVRELSEDGLVAQAKDYLEKFTSSSEHRKAILVDETQEQRLAFEKYSFTVYEGGEVRTALSKETFEETKDKGIFLMGKEPIKDGNRYIRGYFIGRTGTKFALEPFFAGLSRKLLEGFQGRLKDEEIHEIIQNQMLGDPEALFAGRSGNELHYFISNDAMEMIKARNGIEDLLKEEKLKKVNGGWVVSEGDGFYIGSDGSLYYRSYERESRKRSDILVASAGEFSRAYKYVAEKDYQTGTPKHYILYSKRNAFYEKNGKYYERKILGHIEDVNFDENGNAIGKKTDQIVARKNDYIIDEDGYLRAKAQGSSDREIIGEGLYIDERGNLIVDVRQPMVDADRVGNFLLVGGQIVKTEEGSNYEIAHRIDFFAQTDAENEYRPKTVKQLLSLMSYLAKDGNKYAVIQPELEIVNPDESRFAGVIKWAHQLIMYGERVFSSLSGRGPAYGKMTFNLPKYLSDIIDMEVLPWDAESHDTLEAIWGGSKIVPVPAVTEDAPPSYFSGRLIATRWVRGDLKNILSNHPVMKSLNALVQGDFQGASLGSLGEESDEIMSTILFNLLGPAAMDAWLILGLGGMAAGMPVLTGLSLGLFGSVLGGLIVLPNFVFPLYEKATGKAYTENTYWDVLKWGTLQALVSTSIYLMNLVYIPVETSKVIWNRLRGKEEEWLPAAVIERMLQRKMSLGRAYRNLWLVPTVGGAIATTAFLTKNYSFFLWGSPIWFGSFTLGPFVAWYTSQGKAKDFVERIYKATKIDWKK